MADPTTPPVTVDAAAIDAATNSFNKQTEAVNQTNQVLGLFDTTTKTVQNVLGNLSNKLQSAGIDLKNLGDPASMVTSKFGLLATAVVGASESFKGLSNIDSSGLSTYSEQLTDIKNILTGAGTAGGMTKDVIDKLAVAMASAGRPAAEIKNAIASGSDAFFAYAKNILVSADNGLKLQNALLQMSSSTGNFGNILQSAGDDLSGMNDLLAKQSDILSKANFDTKLGASTLNEYWAQLGTIPNVLEEMTVNLGKGNESINILTASTQLATGSGRKYSEVISDLRKAVIDYGLSTSQAFTFTARIAEISQKVKAPLEDVRAALLSSADAFKTFADAGDSSARQSDGFAKIMNTYVQALKETGLSSRNAISLTNQMTSSVKDLRIEQKAFLSQQTGGPGGLMGGFQIDKMLREGKIDEVFDKVRQQMQKQFGKIATLDEAATSPAKAAQLEKQIQILQKGPLGGFAKTDQDAYRILEAFKGRQDGTSGLKGLSQSVVSDQISKGSQIQSLSNTPLSSLRSTLEGIRYTVNVANLGTVQRAFAGSAGISLADTDTLQQKNMRSNINQGGLTNKDATVSSMASDSISMMQNWFKKLPETSKAALQGLGQAISSGKEENIDASKKQLMDDIKANRNASENAVKQQALSEMNSLNKTSALTNFKTSNFSSLGEENFGKISPDSVMTAAKDVVQKSQKLNASKTNANESLNANKDNNAEFNVKVNVNTVCTVCGHHVETSEQTKAVNPTVGY